MTQEASRIRRGANHGNASVPKGVHHSMTSSKKDPVDALAGGGPPYLVAHALDGDAELLQVEGLEEEGHDAPPLDRRDEPRGHVVGVA